MCNIWKGEHIITFEFPSFTRNCPQQLWEIQEMQYKLLHTMFPSIDLHWKMLDKKLLAVTSKVFCQDGHNLSMGTTTIDAIKEFTPLAYPPHVIKSIQNTICQHCCMKNKVNELTYERLNNFKQIIHLNYLYTKKCEICLLWSKMRTKDFLHTSSFPHEKQYEICLCAAEMHMKYSFLFAFTDFASHTH